MQGNVFSVVFVVGTGSFFLLQTFSILVSYRASLERDACLERLGIIPKLLC